jgi:hypothetical protein
LPTDSARTFDQKAQPSSAYASNTASPGAAPLTALLELTYEVLGIRCEPGENFLDHGDSMAAAQLCALGARRHGWKITPRDVFAWESFALLAGVIERDDAERRATERRATAAGQPLSRRGRGTAGHTASHLRDDPRLRIT